MIFTGLLILGVVSLAIAFLLPQKKISNDAKPQDMSSSIPEVTEDRKIPVIFGTVWIENSAIVWFGDVFTVPIKSCAGGKK